MTTAITCTLVKGPIPVGPRRLEASYSLLLPTVWAAAGHAVDLSLAANGGFTYINPDWSFTGSAVTDYGAKFNLIGTEGTGVNEGMLLASSITVVAHIDSAAGGGAEAVEVFDAMPNSTDPSTWDCNLYVSGY